MDAISWTDDCSVHHELIDAQHKELFRRLNVLGDALWNGEGSAVLVSHLRFLADYVVDHFQTEEQIMRETRYPEYDFHKKEHDNFVADVQKLLADIAAGNLAAGTVVKVFGDTCEWTRFHVRKADLELGQYLKKQGGAG